MVVKETGIMEHWNVGRKKEYWNDGRLEYCSCHPLFHYSMIPLFRYHGMTY
jgi:hypothetical protein